MQQLLSSKYHLIPTSETIQASKRARELKEEGKHVINLALGEPDFPPHSFVQEAAIQAIQNQEFKYPPINGVPELISAIQTKLKRDNNLDYQKNQIIVSTGAKQCLANILAAIIDEGDEVIIPSPYWVSYAGQVKMNQGTVIEVDCPADQNYKVKAEQLEAAITERTKAIMFSSPSNPTGMIYTQEELESIAKVLRNYPNILVIADEIYEHIRFIDAPIYSIANCPGMQERTMIVNGMSKAYSLTGWRIGYMAGPAELIAACSKIQSQVTSGANLIAQIASAVALQSSPELLKDRVAEFKNRRDFLLQEFSGISEFLLPTPEGAFYLFPDISGFFGKSYKGRIIQSPDDFCNILLEEYFVSTVSGNAFGYANGFRISYATSMEELKIAAERILTFVSEIK